MFGVVDITTLLGDATMGQLKNVDLKLYDGLDMGAETLLYSKEQLPRQYIPRIQETRTVFIAGRPWMISYDTQLNFRLSAEKEILPSVILFGGSIGYFAFLSIIYLSLNHRRRIAIWHGVTPPR